ncbi:MAG: FtsX-like permease family protein, partial [Candidatus Aminicenantes bacterium]|nr:FtsX-like permease family protein [Candidatus Aminicenantes bacterium]
SIKERTNEIGVRRAVGARQKDILIQFLLEASILSIFGGLIGIFIGSVGSVIVGKTTQWSTGVSLESIILAFGFAVSVGLFFGVYPARKASVLNPIEALRNE